MKKLISLLGAVLLVVSTAGVAAAAATYATSVVDYDGYFMNWDSTDGFYHNEVTEYPDAGADLSWLLGGVDETVAAGWGGDADGGTLTFTTRRASPPMAPPRSTSTFTASGSLQHAV